MIKLPIKFSENDKVGIFIDEANIFYAQKELGWKIDWKKFADLLRQNFNLKILRYYLGMPLSGEQKIRNLKIKKNLESFGYAVISKPLKKIYLDGKKKKFRYKCNFDVEIALDVAPEAGEKLVKLEAFFEVPYIPFFLGSKFQIRQKGPGFY